MTRSRFARRSIPALFLTVFLTACGGSSGTPAVDAKQVQARLDEFVTAITKAEPGSEVVATAEGKAKVETQSDGTVVGTLPRLTVKGSEGNSAVLDPVTIKFSNAGEGLVNVEAILPSAMQVKNKDGKVDGEVKIGSQTLKGVWTDKLQTVDKVDIRLANITIVSPGEPGVGKIDQIAMSGGFDPKGGGLYDGKYQGAVTGISIDDPKEKSSMKIASLGFVANMNGTKMEEFAKAAKEAGYTLANPNIFKAWTGGPLDPKMLAFMKRMPEFMGSVDYSYNLSGIELTKEGRREFALKQTSVGFGAMPDGAGTTKIKMTFGMGGMAGDPSEPFLPPEADVDDASMEIEASGVPGQKLWDIYMDALPQLQAEAAKAASETATGDKDAATAGTAALEQVGTELSGKFMAVLTAAKLQIALNKLNFSTPTAKMTGKGQAAYLPAESWLPEGKVMFRFTGMDRLAAAMQKRGPKDTMAQDIMGYVSAIRAMGKPDPASPKDDRAYLIDIQFTKDGKVLANGQDMLQ